MALQFRKLIFPSIMQQYKGIQNFSSFCGPFGLGLNSWVPIRISFAKGFVGSRICGHGLRLESLSVDFIGRRLLSSGNRKRYPFKARPREVGDSVVLQEGKDRDVSSLNKGHLDAKKQGGSIMTGSSLTEVLDVVATKPPSTRKKPVKPSSKPARRNGDVLESAKKSVQDVKKKKSTTKSNKKTEVAKPLVEEDQPGIDEKKDCELLERSQSSVAEKTKGSRKPSKAKKASPGDAFDVAEASSQVLPIGDSNGGQGKLKPLYPPSGRSVMVVESLTKAKVIQNYLGDMYEVLPSYGHVRDLAGRSRSVRPDDDFSMVWEVPASAWTHLKSIKVALSGAENLILASDPDREGEAIAWHISEMLRQQDALSEHIAVSRVVFHEITESSIKSALQVPRELDSNLVNAYLARRALDYLIGFSISPLLWRKLPGCQSAGRVQSAALGLICDREMEVEQFEPKEYWTVGVEFHVTHSHSLKNRTSIPSLLSRLDSRRLNKLSISSIVEAEAIKERISSSQFKVLAVKTGKITKNPPMPYITSTLQQDSANRLQFSTTYTMKLAQQLYEGIKLSDKDTTGLITYMRTDGLNISNEAANDIHSFVTERYGEKFASKSLQKYFKKVKNAQEAHEAIRPTNIRRLPSSLIGVLDDDSLKLYTLIWARTMACQMEPLSIDTVQVDIGSMEGDLIMRSTGSKVEFPGYRAVYKDKEAGVNRNDDKEEDCTQACFDVLHKLKVEDQLSLGEVELRQHHTKPPPRYSEGALVKKLEELGIGRPSTYASIMKVLQDRNYVTIKNRVLLPEFRGRMVSTFLSHHFSEVADYSFTADMENELDNVSGGVTEWKGLLRDYWSRFSKYCDLATNTDIRQVEKLLEEKFGHILFAPLPDKSKVCPSCTEGTLKFKVSRFGAGYFIGCDQHPKCKYIASTIFPDEDESPTTDKPAKSFPPKLLGCSPDSNTKVFLKNGPYGYYVQLGDDTLGYTPKRASVAEVKDVDSITLEFALDLLQYPIILGNHPEDKHPVLLAHSKFGFSIKHRRNSSLQYQRKSSLKASHWKLD
ncbi:hypothetical protein J5N97_005149 [Dioscorea zingiberensis]|uniref:DNA topoisomerase n=1 Tax=Dioscorea zingiberensis TaxID=325984 RepID=A0A9D5HRY2_9LILI|nr:hypothetical protein J5N97_005149 [Dioscorea zingiberensis]